MKSCRHWKLLAVAVLALSTTTVTAQDQGHAKASRFSGESPNDPSYLLASESVQKELLADRQPKGQLSKTSRRREQTAPICARHHGTLQ